MLNCPQCSSEVKDGFMFCPKCGNDLKRPINCNKCGTTFTELSNFCNNCGTPLSEDKKRKKTNTSKIEVAIPTPNLNGITIEFPFNTAQSYELAVSAAKELPSYEDFGSEKKITHRVHIVESEIASVLSLVELMKGWRKRIVYLDGKRVEWDTVFGFNWCHSRKNSSYKPEFYCYGYEDSWSFNIWGCLHSSLPYKLNDTYRFGKWGAKKGEWVFDKDRIRHELEKSLFSYRFCPAINLNRIKQLIEFFPDSVNPYENNNWEFVESYASQDGAITVIQDSYGLKIEKYIVGVAPKGNSFIKEIQAKLNLPLPDYTP